MSSFFSSLRLRLLCLALLALLPAAGLALYSGFEQRRMAAQQAHAEAQRLTRLTSASIEQTIASANQLLVALAHLPEVREERAGSSSAIFANLLREHPTYANLGLVAPDGHLVASGVPFTGRMDLSDRGWFRRALAQRGFVVGGYQIGRVTRRATLNVACPVRDAGGRMRGVVFAAIDLGYLNGYAARTELPAGAALMVVDRRGVILARYPEPERWVGRLLPEAPSVRAVLAQGAGTAVVRGLDGVTRLWSFNPIPGGPEASAYVAFGLSRDAAYARADRVLRQSLLVLAAVLVLALLAAWAGAKLFILRRMDALASTTERISRGDLAARTGMSGKGDELDQLGCALDAMAASLRSGRATRNRRRRRCARASTGSAASPTARRCCCGSRTRAWRAPSSTSPCSTSRDAAWRKWPATDGSRVCIPTTGRDCSAWRSSRTARSSRSRSSTVCAATMACTAGCWTRRCPSSPPRALSPATSVRAWTSPSAVRWRKRCARARSASRPTWTTARR
ncbi:MAG: cache and HAMP domain-containing protein [Candidatus Eisenbacteria bacterium]|nr:cache and HAMP domain-containing protein [Candidatus Eisenbacteria bacterium]